MEDAAAEAIQRRFAMEDAAEAIRRRFAALSPADLVPGLQFVTCRGATTDRDEPERHRSLQSPSKALESIWRVVGPTGFDETPSLSDDALGAVSFMVVVCDVFDAPQRDAAHNLLLWLDTREVAPPVAMIPARSRSDDPQSPRAVDLVRSVLDAWVHDVIFGERSGYDLAFAIRSSFAKVHAKSEKVMEEFRTRAERADSMRSLKADMNVTLWQYVPPRFGLTLPAVNHRLGDEDGMHLAGYRVQRRLGRGAFGQVFALEPPAGGEREPGGEVVKAICKTMIRSARDLRQLQRIWQIMQMLSGRWRHPNIARSYQIYNSPTKIYIRMEYAGNENLYQRLRARDTGSRPLGVVDLHSLVKQIAAAVRHLHTGPRVCHRDVKPENVVLATTDAQGVTAKLVDFDTAMVQSDRVPCRATCGTFPFMAPEVAEREYSGMMADMWSLGLVMLEMSCHTRIVERRLVDISEDGAPLEEKPHRGCPRKAVQRLKEAFASEGFARSMLVRSHVSELVPVLPLYIDAISNLAILDAAARWTSVRLDEKLQAASVASLNCEHRRRNSSGDGQRRSGVASIGDGIAAVLRAPRHREGRVAW
mmetsp:Transcript_56803/g.164814  ORF Transcript_56803/g.164814 Transcript_56803/m.164814 type:complete len:590 (+) Transcript_56803:133-1902(+)